MTTKPDWRSLLDEAMHQMGKRINELEAENERLRAGATHSPEEPVRLCCGQRHWSVVCPDGLVMCCICFGRFEPNDETREDVCPRCRVKEDDR
jgi:hypothetical protein